MQHVQLFLFVTLIPFYFSRIYILRLKVLTESMYQEITIMYKSIMY